MVNPMNLAGRRILVTGASSGIGRATAVCAAALGARLLLVGRRREELERTRAAMTSPELHDLCVGDLTDAAFIARLVRQVAEEGGADGLVHAAGACPVMPLGVVAENLLVDALKVNYVAFMQLMRGLASGTAAKKGFSAVAVSSVSAEVGWAGGSLYAGAKGAVSAAVRALAIELAPKGMRVNAVCPSGIRTPMLDALVGAEERATAARAAMEARHPLGFGTPEQVASAVCFLLSESASFITGVNLPVDGGYLAQ